jgi:hypothetical protein
MVRLEARGLGRAGAGGLQGRAAVARLLGTGRRAWPPTWARWKAEATSLPSGETRRQAALGCGCVRPAGGGGGRGRGGR